MTQVLSPEGEYVPATSIKGSIIVNIADIMHNFCGKITNYHYTQLRSRARDLNVRKFYFVLGLQFPLLK